VIKTSRLELRTEQDVVRARQEVRQHAQGLRFSLVDQTKLVTAASELARNAVVHGGGGTMEVEVLEEGARRGLRLHFSDKGPGIADIGLAMPGPLSMASTSRVRDGGVSRQRSTISPPPACRTRFLASSVTTMPRRPLRTSSKPADRASPAARRRASPT
jgi:anti-sigma regulatory factor (Ser/Thr protein kinase)